MGPGSTVSFSAAFAAGLLTFLSPCILPLIPVYISYITGVSFDELKEGGSRAIRKKTLVHSLFFILGFSLVFVALGASASYLGRFLIEYKAVIARIGGALIIIFGLYLMGVFKLGFLDRERKLTFKFQKGSKFSSVLFGIIFAAAWTPCVGPILGSILVLAGIRNSMFEGIWLLSIYSLGIAVPFIISALLISSFLAHFARFKKYMFAVKFICGLLLIIIGLLLLLRVNVI
ncbi:cytochrome c biogenesis protein CcdA [bacterium]|nr:cytochrome c biogenesis protein CcdA [bacterium]